MNGLTVRQRFHISTRTAHGRSRLSRQEWRHEGPPPPRFPTWTVVVVEPVPGPPATRRAHARIVGCVFRPDGQDVRETDPDARWLWTTAIGPATLAQGLDGNGLPVAGGAASSRERAIEALCRVAGLPEDDRVPVYGTPDGPAPERPRPPRGVRLIVSYRPDPVRAAAGLVALLLGPDRRLPDAMPRPDPVDHPDDDHQSPTERTLHR